MIIKTSLYQNLGSKRYLLRYSTTIKEGCRQIVVKVDHKVLLDGDPGIPLLDPSLHPSGEVVPNHCVHKID